MAIKAKAPAGTRRRGKAAAPVKEAWTAAKQADFIAELSRTCNVSASVRAVSMSESSVYRQRARSPAFRAAWEAALKVAYERLEMELLQRALKAALEPEEGAPAPDEKLRSYSDGLAFKLLAAHRASATDAGPDALKPARSARERIEAKLAEMNRRMGGDD